MIRALFLALVLFWSSIATPTFAEDNLRELLLASLANHYSDDLTEVEIAIFDAKEASTAPCVPESAKLVGGYSHSGSTTWIFRLAGSGRSALATCISLLKENGFAQEKQSVGLVGVATSALLCAEDRVTSFSVALSEGRHYLIETDPAFATDCTDFGSLEISPPPSVVPRLQTPEGVFSQGGSSSWSINDFSSSQTLFSVAVSEDLLDHYSDTIVSAGWHPRSRLISENAALAGFEKSIDGVSWMLSIVHTRVPRGVTVHLFVRSNEK